MRWGSVRLGVRGWEVRVRDEDEVMGVRGLAPAQSGLGLGSRARSGLDTGWSDKSKGGVSFFPRCLVQAV